MRHTHTHTYAAVNKVIQQCTTVNELSLKSQGVRAITIRTFSGFIQKSIRRYVTQLFSPFNVAEVFGNRNTNTPNPFETVTFLSAAMHTRQPLRQIQSGDCRNVPSPYLQNNRICVSPGRFFEKQNWILFLSS